jgi:acylphosphatase
VTDRRCQRFFIAGKVQGVWFRASTAQQATRLGLVGWARNLADGRVEVLAAGSAGAIEEFTQWLHAGPPAAEVARVEVVPATHDECAALTDFRTG